jgi:hypothetical protein
MSKRTDSVLREKTNLQSLVLALLALLLGVVVLYLSGQDEWWQRYRAAQSVLRDLGALIVVTVAISLLWELKLRRGFLDEFWTKAEVAESVRAAGLIAVADSFIRDVDWRDLFEGASKLDIFFAYERTWRSSHTEELARLVTRDDGRIRVVMPDPDATGVMVELSRRFSMSAEELVRNIRDTEEYFQRLGANAGQGRGNVQLWYLPELPVFTFYRFDRRALLALYTYQKDRPSVPALLVEAGGTLYDFVRREFDAMINPDVVRARRVF